MLLLPPHNPQFRSFFVTSNTHQRQAWFSRRSLARILVDQIDHYALEFGACVHTYCVLSDHYHLVISLPDDGFISKYLHAVHSYTVTLISDELGLERKPKVWQGNPWCHFIRNEQQLYHAMAYSLLNPWRLGVVARPTDRYALSNIGEFLDAHGKDVLLDLFEKYG